ncbi:MAG: hypothetical protein WA652_17105 [Xanthobacteraceae bacterium]
MYVIGRLDSSDDFCGCCSESFPEFARPKATLDEDFFRGMGAKWAETHADDGQSGALADTVAHRQRGRGAGEGEISQASGKFHKRHTGAGGRSGIAQLYHYFTGAQRRGQDAGEKILRGKLAAARGARNHHRAVERYKHARVFRCGIVMGDAAAHRSAIPDRRMGDLFGGFEQQWPAGAQPVALQKIGMPNQRADSQAVVGDAQHIERLDSIDIDQDIGAKKPAIEHRHQALAARQDPAFAPGVGQDAQCFFEAPRRVIIEPCRLHGSLNRVSM